MAPLIGRHGFENRLGPDNRTNIAIIIPSLPKDVNEERMRNAGTREIDDVSCDSTNQARARGVFRPYIRFPMRYPTRTKQRRLMSGWKYYAGPTERF